MKRDETTERDARLDAPESVTGRSHGAADLAFAPADSSGARPGVLGAGVAAAKRAVAKLSPRSAHASTQAAAKRRAEIEGLLEAATVERATRDRELAEATQAFADSSADESALTAARLARDASLTRVEDLGHALELATVAESRAAIEDLDATAAKLGLEIDDRLASLSGVYDEVLAALESLVNDAHDLDRLMMRVSQMKGGKGLRITPSVARLRRSLHEMKLVRPAAGSVRHCWF
jgi:hypothetical protein